MINSTKECFTKAQTIIFDIRALLQQRSDSVVYFTYRETSKVETSKVVHSLVTLACATFNDSICLEERMSNVTSFVSFDKSYIDSDN